MLAFDRTSHAARNYRYSQTSWVFTEALKRHAIFFKLFIANYKSLNYSSTTLNQLRISRYKDFNRLSKSVYQLMLSRYSDL